jgi:uncharacterized protein (DUF305 family)
MDNNRLAYAIGGLIVGLLLAWIFARGAVNNNNDGMMRMMGMRMPIAQVQTSNSDHMHSSMEGMMRNLQGKSGADFDQAFLAEMIVHHQGAISMAISALQNAERQELKDLAKEIIEAQSNEISQMESWQRQWAQ